MCVPILRPIRTKLTKLENMQKSCFIWRHVTQKRYVMFVTRTAHDVLDYPCEVSLESIQ